MCETKEKKNKRRKKIIFEIKKEKQKGNSHLHCTYN